MINIRLATTDDLDKLEDIFLAAKQTMRRDGNMHQWTEADYPICYTRKDLNNKSCYVVEDDGEITATFVLQLGEEITYKIIDNGAWLNSRPYATIHRIASNGHTKDIFGKVLQFDKQFDVDTRIDTSKDNKRMTHLIQKHNFIYCGTIYIRDGSPRDAYQKLKEGL